MEEQKIEVRCPFMDMMREYFPLIPVVVPILFPIVPLICVVLYVGHIGASVRHIEEQLDEILTAVRRIS
ncbi:MAG: hypothetical protein U9R79_00860 [Armatimonadota bacterium]|nr:hypothetical protein [Armatimonadota bacterium]